MKKDIYFRIDTRVQNGVVKYYLLREVNSDSRKFRASKLIKAGVMPTDAEISRAILLHGFDLEIKCCEKVASYRIKNFRYEYAANEEAYRLLEKYRYPPFKSECHTSSFTFLSCPNLLHDVL